MPPIAPPNSATQTTLRPIHIHIVDEFNLDTSLEVASTMLASPNLASCQQIRISTSGLHPSLSAHPKLTSSSSSSSSSFSYGKTSLVQLQNVLGLSNEKLERYQLVTSTPRNFLTLERKCTRSSTTSPTPFDVVICCSQEVFNGVCQYYSTSSFQMKNKDASTVIASQTLMSPHSVFVVFVDSKYYSNTTNNQTNNNSNNKPTQGLLLTSLLVELLDLVHLKRKSSTQSNDDASGVKKEEESEIARPGILGPAPSSSSTNNSVARALGLGKNECEYHNANGSSHPRAQTSHATEDCHYHRKEVWKIFDENLGGWAFDLKKMKCTNANAQARAAAVDAEMKSKGPQTKFSGRRREREN